MWRVRLRISVDSDKKSKIRNKLAPILQQSGFAQRGDNTGSWQTDKIEEKDAVDTLHRVLQILVDPQTQVTNPHPDALLDHVWLYIEKAIG